MWDAAGAIAEGGAASAAAAATAAETGLTTGKDRVGEGEIDDDGLAGDELLDFGEFVVLEVRFKAYVPDSLPRGSPSLSPFRPLITLPRVLVVALAFHTSPFPASTPFCMRFAPASWQVLRLQRITPDDLASMRAIFDTMDTDRSGQVRTRRAPCVMRAGSPHTDRAGPVCDFLALIHVLLPRFVPCHLLLACFKKKGDVRGTQGLPRDGRVQTASAAGNVVCMTLYTARSLNSLKIYLRQFVPALQTLARPVSSSASVGIGLVRALLVWFFNGSRSRSYQSARAAGGGASKQASAVSSQKHHHPPNARRPIPRRWRWSRTTSKSRSYA